MFLSKREKITPAQTILIGFALLILSGALLLMLPIATYAPGGASFGDALFTATSATCVTGLAVQDTATYWTPFGHVVILLLIQIGGLGVVTTALALTMLAGKRIGLKQRWVMQESISAPQMGGIVRMTGFILRSVLVMEGTGAAFLAVRFCPEMGFWRGLWYAVFHAISAFCNAGFDLMGTPESKFVSLTGYATDGIVNCVIMAMIMLGGIGFLTWQDAWERKLHFHEFRLQSKLALTVTAFLLVLPAIFFYFYEFGLPQWSWMSEQERFWASMFQSVTPRTAGFNTVDLTLLSEPSQMVLILLMVIGGAPGSTAGGFKVTTLAVFFLSVFAVLHRRGSLECFGRRLSPEILRNAVTIAFMYVVLTVTGGIIIAGVEGLPVMKTLFECASAIGTVGLSLGITTEIGAFSRMILVFLMYFGRVGGLTLIYAVLSAPPPPAQLPQERITVG